MLVMSKVVTNVAEIFDKVIAKLVPVFLQCHEDNRLYSLFQVISTTMEIKLY